VNVSTKGLIMTYSLIGK